MTEANILNGWREPDEDPKIDCPLLVVYKDHEYNMIIRVINSQGIESARNERDRTLLAWQYVPEWVEE